MERGEATETGRPVAVSIVVPFRDEEENVAPVLRELRAACPEAQIIAVDDGSDDATVARIPPELSVELVCLPSRSGQSAAIHAGLRVARGEACVLMDGDGQSDPSEIKRLLHHLPAYDFVTGRRVARGDPPLRVWVSRAANAIRRLVLRDGVRDTGGTPKVMKRACVEALVPFDGMHRFIPALLRGAGFRGLEVSVSHRPRLGGSSHYGTSERALRGIWDLIGVRWLLSRQLPSARPSSRAGDSADRD